MIQRPMRATKSRPRPSSGPIVFRLVSTDWGYFGLVATHAGKLLATFLPQSENHIYKFVASRFPSATESKSACASLVRQVDDYFRGRRISWEVEIDWQDLSGFRRSVLEACRRIPFGSTASYADLARAAGSPGAARAVGSAMANNPLPLIVPCHRVLCSDGSLGGFSSPQGCSQKLRMLKLENPNFGLISRFRTMSRKEVEVKSGKSARAQALFTA